MACGLQLVTLLVMLSRALMNPCGSPPTSCSVGLSVSSAVEKGIYAEPGGKAGGDLSVEPTCHKQKTLKDLEIPLETVNAQGVAKLLESARDFGTFARAG